MDDPSTPAPPPEQRRVPGVVNEAASLGMGVGIIVAYVIFLAMMFSGFAGYVARVNLSSQWATAAPDGAAGSLDEYILIYARIGALSTQIETGKQAIANHSSQVETTQRAWVDANTEVAKAHAELDEMIKEASVLMDQAGIQAAGVFDVDAPPRIPGRVGRLRGHLSGIIATAGDEDLQRKLEDIRATLDANSDAYIDTYRTLEAVVADQTLLEKKGGLIQADFNQISFEYEELRTRMPEDQQAILNAFKSTLFGEIPFEMLKIPTILLTLIVTIAAGGLGAVVAFTRKFLFDSAAQGGVAHDQKIGLARLLLNIGEGVAASLAIFLFAGTGLLVLTQGASTKGDMVEMSPYLVAFLAFVSGFMAEDAFARIQKFGKDTFNPG